MEQSWGELLKELLYEMKPQSNFHGSGEIFEKFDKRFIGTGQGAKAHGYGFYSADNPVISAGYVMQQGKPVKFRGVKSDKIVDILDAVKKGVDVKPESDFLYKVNVPNTNFLLDENLPLYKQPMYVQKAIKNLASDLPNRKFYINSPEYFMNSMTFEDTGKDFYDGLTYLLGKQEKNADGSYSIGSLNTPHKHGQKRASELLSRHGIKGIRGYGKTDGKINIVFSDRDIKMANTPLQRIANRIPTQTLGKIGNKVNKALQPVLTHPAVQTGGKVLNALDKYGRGLSTIMLPQSVMYQFDNGQGQVW